MNTTPTSADKARDLLDKAAGGDCRRSSHGYYWDSDDGAQRDAQAGIGIGLLAIHEDLANLRGDLADIAAAVRELAPVQRRPRRWSLRKRRDAFNDAHGRVISEG